MHLFQYLLAIMMVFSTTGEFPHSTDSRSPGAEAKHLQPQQTVEVIGIDKMKFVVAENTPAVVVGDTVTTADGSSYLELEAIRVEPGSRLTVELRTKSELPEKSMSHNWVLLKHGADRDAFDKAAVLAVDNKYIPQEKEYQLIANTGMAAGGETASVSFEVPRQQGLYDYLCSFPGHFANGMRGKLIVQQRN